MPPRLPPSASGLSRSLGRGIANSTTLAPAPCRACNARIASSRPRPAAAGGFHTSSPAQYAAAPGAAFRLPDDYVPPTQPPSAKKPDLRKSQLLRTYTSLLRSTPLLLVFQHSNLTGPEWAALRRELALSMEKVTKEQKSAGVEWPEELVPSIRMQVIKHRMFDLALRITEFYDPSTIPEGTYGHDLSKAAAEAVKKAVESGVTASPETSAYAQLAPLLIGPLAVLSIPAVSPAHLAGALSILSPNAPDFPAPKRKSNPGYYEPDVQSALQKLILVGGRVEGKVFDIDGLRYVGSIPGGLQGLQAQLVHLLQSAGMSLTSTLEGTSKSLWLTMESRRSVLEEGEKPAEEKKEEA